MLGPARSSTPTTSATREALLSVSFHEDVKKADPEFLLKTLNLYRTPNSPYTRLHPPVSSYPLATRHHPTAAGGWSLVAYLSGLLGFLGFREP